jgi:hypothetical protein
MDEPFYSPYKIPSSAIDIIAAVSSGMPLEVMVAMWGYTRGLDTFTSSMYTP